ncbi:hypothetical protein [Reyranella sp.]|uniref:hypothetical protein n=1 Tax=Reyranella sp. TaxID=1929291 RepID=UPI003D0AA664
MSDKPVDLDKHRGMAAQKATDLRRLLGEVEANASDLRRRQEELETQLIAAPAESWAEAAAKARYLLGLYAASLPSEDTRQRTLVAAVLRDFDRLAQIS